MTRRAALLLCLLSRCNTAVATGTKIWLLAPSPHTHTLTQAAGAPYMHVKPQSHTNIESLASKYYTDGTSAGTAAYVAREIKTRTAQACDYGALPGRWIESGWGHDDNRRWQVMDEDCQLSNLLLAHLNSEWEAGPVNSERHRNLKVVGSLILSGSLSPGKRRGGHARYPERVRGMGKREAIGSGVSEEEDVK